MSYCFLIGHGKYRLFLESICVPLAEGRAYKMQMNIKFNLNNPAHRAAVGKITGRSKGVYPHLADYVAEAVLDYEEMNREQRFLNQLRELLNEYDIRRRKQDMILPRK